MQILETRRSPRSRGKRLPYLACFLLPACLCAGGGGGEVRGSPRAYAGPIVPDVLTIEAAKRIALERNPDLDAAAARVRAARAVLSQTLAAYRPSLQLRAGTTRVQHAPAGADDPWYRYEAALQSSWIVFDGFARRYAALAARRSVEASVAADADARRILLQAVGTACLDALLARENMRIAEQDAAFNQRLMEESQKRLDAGAAARSEVLNFQIRAKRAEAQRITAEELLRIRRIILGQLLGLPEAGLPAHVKLQDIETILPEDRRPDPDLAFAEALANRPDLERLRAELAAQRALVDRARARRLPRVELSAAAAASRRDDPALRWDADGTATAALTLTWDLYTGGLRTAEIREARERANETDARLRSRVLAVHAEIQRVIERLNTARRLLRVQNEVYRLSVETRDLVRNEYLVGRASLARLNQTQADLVRAEGALASARIRYRQAMEDLDAATARDLARFEKGTSP